MLQVLETTKKATLLIESKACHQEVCSSVCRFRSISNLISLCHYKEVVHRFVFPDRRLFTTLIQLLEDLFGCMTPVIHL